MTDVDDVLSLPADTLAILEQFRREQDERERLEMEGEVPVAEDWQLSQFWYAESTALTLCKEAVSALGPDGGQIAVVSAPTLVQYFHQMEEFKTEKCSLKLFEYDTRFGVKYPAEFIPYDYKQPLAIPEPLRGQFDLVIADPPFLADECLVKTAQTVKLLMKPDAKILFCTGAIMEEMLGRLLHCRRLSFQPQHSNNLANDFACFANYESVHLGNIA